MLTNVEVFNPLIPVSPLVVTEGQSPFQIHKVDGLEPVAATINTAELGEIEGEAYMGSSVGKRNIVITFGLYPDPSKGQTVAILRQMLYTYFMPRSQVRLRFHNTHMPAVDISGHVEDFAPTLFSKEPEYAASIICEAPDFLDISPTVFNGVTIATGADDPILIEYLGTKPAGFLVKVDSTAAAPTHNGDILIDLMSPKESGTMLVDTVVDSSHELQVQTIPGSKFIHSNFPGSSSFENILGQLSLGSKWLQLYYGKNYFQVKSETPGQDWTLIYTNRFGGI